MINFEFLNPISIEEIHVEVSNLCNAACPMCARNNNGYALTNNPGWGTWNPEDEKLVFSDELPNLKKVYFCGTHGDPLTLSFLPDVIKFCKQKNLTVEIFTNGSLRSIEWWSKLIEHLRHPDKIIFGIDGVETNHLYRQNTNIDVILERVKLCTDQKLNVQWDFLAFKHNEHELETCKKIAEELGVTNFRIRKTARFSKDKIEVRNKNNVITHYLEPPTNDALKHPNYHVIQNLYSNKPENYNINCLYKESKKIYVNSRLDVFPCCYISDLNEKMKLNLNYDQLKVPIEFMNLKKFSWKQILSLPFYQKELVKSFYSDNTIRRCIFTCGVVNRESNQNEVIDKNA